MWLAAKDLVKINEGEVKELLGRAKVPAINRYAVS